MLTQAAKIPNSSSADERLDLVASKDKAPASAEIVSLYRIDEDLPDRIRANFRSAQTAKAALLVHLDGPWDDRTEVLFKSLNTAIHLHLKFISVHMYVPLKQRLKFNSKGGFKRFLEFESNANKSYVMLTSLMRKYYRSGQFFNTEYVQEMKADVERVLQEMTQQLNRERAYLFPRYLSDR